MAECKELSLEEAIAEYDKQKEAGKKPVIVATEKGYTVIKAIFKENNDITKK